jgi:hypothetical protein
MVVDSDSHADVVRSHDYAFGTLQYLYFCTLPLVPLL